ncbi:ATP-binding protein [Streptomyces caniscabiei]|uniref:ATP-binding protein n=1 Tax=Streptomyces caniscabiei TaxID=2746961 RepID=UPI0029A3ADB8|nr:ATP-binding protein [Streptomyces caniscabiei]MDX2775995.1 ATP-binding protein [Streptomyces caniscabiei]
MNIRQKFIILLLLIGVLPMFVVSVVSYFSIRESLLNKTIDQLNSTAIKQEQKINTFLQTHQEEVTKLSNQYDLQVSLRDYLANPSDVNKEHLSVILQGKKIETPGIQSIFMTDASGKVLASSSQSASAATNLDAPAANGEASVSVRKDPSDGFTKLYITTNVSINKERAALLSVVFRTDDLIAIVQDYTGLDETGETVVVAKDNISLFPLRFDTNAALQTNLASMKLRDFTTVRYGEVTDYRGHATLVVAHPAGFSDWVVAAKIDRSEALSATTGLRNIIIALVFVALVGIVLVALFFSQLFTRPIRKIAQVAEQIGQGDFAARVGIARSDELGSLAGSINAMGSNLQDMVGNIESQRMRLQVILDSTTETIFAIDERANILLVNKAVEGLLQTPPTSLTGKSMHDIFAWRHGLQPFTVNYDIEGVHTYSNLQYVDSTGTQRYVKLIVARIKDETHAGKAHAIVTIHDETSSHELENMKADFVSMAAHELRTPLTAVRGYLEMVQYKQQHNDPADVDTYVRQALKNVSDLGGLINNLLDITRIERGTLTLSMEKVDLAANVSQVVNDQRFAAEDRQLTLTYHGPAQGCFVVGDPIALREVINNMLANAIKYTKPNGKVDVTVQPQNDTCSVIVKDTGIGIPASAQKHLFSKFYRVHGGLDSGSTGTGLGLYIARSIAERHQGTIAVDSQEGIGSTFTLTIPAFTDERLASVRPVEDAHKDSAKITRRKRGWITKNITR